MHLTTTLLLSTLTLTSATSLARVSTAFLPACPSPETPSPYAAHSPFSHPTTPDSSPSLGDPNTNNIMAPYTFPPYPPTNLAANTCTPVTIPYDRAPLLVSHVSVEAELVSRDPHDQCNVTVHEVPGCKGKALIREAVGEEKKGGCAQMGFFGYGQVWLELECEAVVPVVETHAGLNETHQGLNGTHTGLNGTHAGLNGTIAGLNGTHAGLNGTIAGLNGTRAGLNGTHAGLNSSLPLNSSRVARERSWRIRRLRGLLS